MAGDTPTPTGRSPVRRMTRLLPVGKHPLQLYLAGDAQRREGHHHGGRAAGARPAPLPNTTPGRSRSAKAISSAAASSPSIRIPRSRRCSTAPSPSRSACSNPVRSPSISPSAPGALLPTERAARAECMSWLFWQMGSTPYVGGGFGHFTPMRRPRSNMPSTASPWRRNASSMSSTGVWRKANMSPATATPSPTSRSGRGMAVWRRNNQYGGSEFLSVQEYKNVQRWTTQIGARPAVKTRPQGQPPERRSRVSITRAA